MEVQRFIALIILKTALTQEYLQHGKILVKLLDKNYGELELSLSPSFV